MGLVRTDPVPGQAGAGVTNVTTFIFLVGVAQDPVFRATQAEGPEWIGCATEIRTEGGIIVSWCMVGHDTVCAMLAHAHDGSGCEGTAMGRNRSDLDVAGRSAGAGQWLQAD